MQPLDNDDDDDDHFPYTIFGTAGDRLVQVPHVCPTTIRS